MPYVTNDTVRVYYEVEGSGPPLILQHGFFWSGMGWRRVGYVDALKDRFQLILIDARGHGRSYKPHDSSAYKLETLVSDITSVLDDMGLPTAHYWGYSMGGWFGFGLANYALERVRSFIIGGSHPYARRLPPESRPSGADPDAFVSAFFDRLGIERANLSDAELAEFYDNDFLALAAMLRDRPALETALSDIEVPCLLYVGAEDGALNQMSTCADLIPNGGLEIIPGLNHPEAFYDFPAVFPHIEQFLNQFLVEQN
jgi:pimeloyl-ACP methyl ester carboxylesterase